VRIDSVGSKLLAAGLAASMVVVGIVVATGTSQAAGRAKKTPLLYVSLGDSYSVGYQNPSLGNTAGFTGYVAKKEKLQLENFGCGGATTTSIFSQIGCSPSDSAATDGVPYPATDQVDAALAFIAAHPGQIGLVTVSIGGNDVTACAGDANPITCVVAAEATIKSNVDHLVTELDAALTTGGDTSAHLVGITYPDVILGDDVYPVGSTNPTLAGESVAAFDSLINPTLSAAYTAVPEGAFVDVTSAPYKKATAGDDTDTWAGAVASGPTTGLKGFGKGVPDSVWEVCTLTYYCSITGDIHANTKGYDFIGSLITAKLASL
jgi:lysophospholipase L1-like esterase